MTGYQEILTDPSYKGQIVTMTYPLIGNYGINRQDVESRRPHVAGFVIKELPPVYSNYRADMSLDEYLKQNKIIGIEGIDTRALTRKLRISGAMRGILSTETLTTRDLVDRARHGAQMAGADWVQAVKPDDAYDWDQDQGDWRLGKVERGDGLHVVALDCGAKSNILRHLTERGVKVTVLPPDTTAEEILSHRPDGLFVSNGPGDPAVLDYAVKPIQARARKSSPSSASASAINCSAGPSARRPTSSSSAIAAATSRSRTSTPAASKSPARTTASPSTRRAWKPTAASSPTST